MVAIPLTSDGVLNVKRALRDQFPGEKSAHLTEALATACGFRNHAALLTEISRSDQVDPDYVMLDAPAFLQRLGELTGRGVPARNGIFDQLDYSDSSMIVKTASKAGSNTSDSSKRARAWRNVMVCAINAGIEQKLFSIRPGDNRWLTTAREPSALIFYFQVGDIPAVASVRDAGWDELSFHVAFWPTEDANRWIVCQHVGFFAGEVTASGWLERRDGAWLQVASKPDFHCRKGLIDRVATIEVRPKGYADRGDFKI